MGLPPSLASGSDLREIAQLCRDYPCYIDFAAQIDVQRHLAKFCVALKECKEHALRMSLIRLFSDELDATRNGYRGKWAVETELQFLGAKMFLYGFSFRSRNRNPEVSDSTTASEMNSSLHVLLYEAMGVAAKMIYTFSELKDQDDDGSHFETSKFPPQIFFPKHYIFSFCYACLVLYHFLEANTQAPKSEQDLARNHVGFAYSTLTRCGTENNIEVARLAQWLELMGKWNRSNRVVPHVTSRLGASLFYESVLKSATLKAEMGSRSRAADVSRPFDEEQRKETSEREEAAPKLPKSQNMEWLIPPEQGQQQGLVGDINDQYSWQGWEDQLQGWDLSMLNGVGFTVGMDAGNGSRKSLY
jgi:hypothetical protein